MTAKALRVGEVVRAWGRILKGYQPFLSVEITRECPLQCPGCYAYQPEHLGAAGPLRPLGELKGEALGAGHRGPGRRLPPLHRSVGGGAPVVRYRAPAVLLPKLLPL